MTISIALEAYDILSYPMAHNGIGLIIRIDITNSGSDLDEAQLVIAVTDDEGPVSHEFTQAVALQGNGAVTTLRDTPVRLDPAALLQVRDPRPGLVTVSIRSGERVLASTSQPVTLLAGNQWLSQPPGLAYELLTSFVMPNDPAIGKLLNEAAALLQADTGNPSMEGYQSGEDRVDAIATSIWDAALRRRIRYVEPPASWWETGQKVRSPAEVLDEGLGTCLDTTVVLAAAFEQAGLRPLLWVLKGHAFLGYWRTETSLETTKTTDAHDVMNSVDLGQLRLVETTAVTVSETPTPFADTHRLALQHLQDGLEIVSAVIDVFACRRIPIFPLPVRRTTDSGVEIIEYRPAAHSPRERVFHGSGPQPTKAAATSTPPRVQQWKNNLLDLSLRNRLINYTDRAGVRLRVPDGRLGQIEDLLHAGKPLGLRPSDDIEATDNARGLRNGWDLPPDRVEDLLSNSQAVYTDTPTGGYLARMRNLAYKARTIQEETGANNLYLALGSLAWNLDGRELRSPLILVPVKLVTRFKGQHYRLELDESGGSTPNYCLLEKLRQTHGLSIPALANPVEDLSGIDLDAALQATRAALAESGMPAHVQPTADLSILQFAKFRLWKDLDEHWERLSRNPLVRHLIESPTQPFVDPTPAPAAGTDLDALDATCPIPADASQLEAIAEATAGRTFVLEGPPGTGKSQTITNLLTRAVAEGKRVLFVAEKRAALDVVSSRLESVGMGPFCLDLHDKGSKPTVVRAQIKQGLEHAAAVDQQELAVQEEDLRSSRQTLARYAKRLHETNSAGLSYYSARTAMLTLGAGGPALPIPAEILRRADLVRQLRRILQRLPDTADLARPRPDHPWAFAQLVDPSQSEVGATVAAAMTLDRAVALLPTEGPLSEVLRTVRTTADLTTLASLLETTVSLADLDTMRTEAWLKASKDLTLEVATFVAAAHPELDVATPHALGPSLADIYADAQAAEASGFFRRGKRRKLVLARLQPALRPDATVPPRDLLPLVTGLMQLQGAVHGLAGKAGALAGLSVPPSWHPFNAAGRRLLRKQVAWLTWAGQAVDPKRDGHSFVRAVRDWLGAGVPPEPAEVAAVQTVDTAFRTVVEASGASAYSIARWSGQVGLIGRWAATTGQRSPERADQDLRRWCAFDNELTPLHEAGLSPAADALATGAVRADDAVRAFDQGIALASLAERRAATGLDGFDGPSHNQVVDRFTASVHDVRRGMTTAIPAQVIRARPFQASTGRGQVGELQRELAKQRRGLGVRGLMQKYGELITQVMPCVLVSPDSVARFFPVGGQQFDLVVFDEASQIRVADAIGAMGRSTSVVVVGDSKQMPPTTFAEAKIGSDDETTPEEVEVVEDEESILTEAVLARVPQRWLTWHYRSQDESLIAFSNAHYYESKLSSFPAPTHAGADVDRGVGVSLVKVCGTFHRSGAGRLLRTNPEEAAAVCAEIQGRFRRSPGMAPSLGVVTFNQQQRAYIEALIRDSQDQRMVEALDGTNGEGLFIKNLENVQGDERDVILFSTAFSVNDKGVLPLNFGPLTRSGGERRLNVAITRARQQVMVFTSFDPAQIRVEETQSKGIRHLRAYLELAAYGAAALDGSVRRGSLPDRHRDEIADRLRDRGLIVETGVGLSDFRVDLTLADAATPDQQLVAVLLDGPGWASRRTVGDRDGLPAQVLAGLMRWPAVERVWLPSWLADPEGTVAHLLEIVDEARACSIAPPTAPPVEPAPLLVTIPPVAVQARGLAEPRLAPIASVRSAAAAPVIRLLDNERPFDAYVPLYCGPRTVLDELPSRSSIERVSAVAVEVVAHEGPVHLDRLARLVAASFDLTRLNQARINSIVRAVPAALRRDRRELFAWPADLDRERWTAFRSAPPDIGRPLDHIALPEIGNAMVALCRDAAGMEEQELAAETLGVFGFKRRTSAINARLDAARDLAISRGLLRRGSAGRIEVGLR